MVKKNVESRIELAQYSTLPEELEVLANDKSSEVRYNVAVNPCTPVQLLEKLTVDIARSIREGVTRNPNVPVSLLEKLAADKDADVRTATAKNPNLRPYRF